MIAQEHDTDAIAIEVCFPGGPVGRLPDRGGSAATRWNVETEF